MSKVNLFCGFSIGFALAISATPGFAQDTPTTGTQKGLFTLHYALTALDPGGGADASWFGTGIGASYLRRLNEDRGFVVDMTYRSKSEPGLRDSLDWGTYQAGVAFDRSNGISWRLMAGISQLKVGGVGSSDPMVSAHIVGDDPGLNFGIGGGVAFTEGNNYSFFQFTLGWSWASGDTLSSRGRRAALR